MAHTVNQYAENTRCRLLTANNQYTKIYIVDYNKRIDLPRVIYCVIKWKRKEAKTTEGTVQNKEKSDTSIVTWNINYMRMHTHVSASQAPFTTDYDKTAGSPHDTQASVQLEQMKETLISLCFETLAKE